MAPELVAHPRRSEQAADRANEAFGRSLQARALLGAGSSDEAVGFTGGVGIADCWKGDARSEAEWRDSHFRIEGPAVDGLRAAFLDNLPGGDG